MKVETRRPAVLAAEDMQRIYDAAIRVVKRVPLRCQATDELFSPELADRRVAGAWFTDPTTMLDRARARASDLVATAPNRCPLDAAARSAIREILDDADREATARA